MTGPTGSDGNSGKTEEMDWEPGEDAFRNAILQKLNVPAFNASSWAPRDPSSNPAEDSDEEERKEPTNTHQLLDNCYYVTAAALLDTTTEELIEQSQVMQMANGAPTANDIAEFFQTVGLPSAYQNFTKLDQVVAVAEKASQGFTKRFGLAFRRPDTTGHMVVLEWNADEQVPRFLDSQVTEEANAETDVGSGVDFYLFGPV